MKITLNSLEDIYSALENDLITPSVAVSVTCKALTMVDIRLKDEPYSKEYVLSELQGLIDNYNPAGETPIFFGMEGEFNIKNVFKNEVNN
jgi:hypothetical protein